MVVDPSSRSVSPSNRFDCTICLEEMQEEDSKKIFSCVHLFHGACIGKWLETHTTCPNCRVTLLSDKTEQPTAQEMTLEEVLAVPDHEQTVITTDEERGLANIEAAIAIASVIPVSRRDSSVRRTARNIDAIARRLISQEVVERGFTPASPIFSRRVERFERSAMFGANSTNNVAIGHVPAAPLTSDLPTGLGINYMRYSTDAIVIGVAGNTLNSLADRSVQ